jgi:hypothetical protein
VSLERRDHQLNARKIYTVDVGEGGKEVLARER